MQISDSGLKFLEKEEGVVLHPYKDSVGVPTIGMGTTVYPDGTKVTMNDPNITPEQADQYAKYHLEHRVYPYVNKVIVQINQNQFDALCSFVYNIGGEGFSGSTLLKKINSNAPCSEIHVQFLRWNKAGGKPILTARRQREANLYC